MSSTSTLEMKAGYKQNLLVAASATLISFLAYSSVYAFRKPFTVATFEGISYWGLSYQTLLIISQGVGYMLSKFFGIKYIAELKRNGRWKAAIVLIGIAWFSLLIFAIIPAPFGMLCLLVNGFVLGFTWGIVFSYIEGRRATDLIGSIMAVSFIFAGGFTRSVAKWLILNFSIEEKWMPFLTGLIFIGPLLLFIFLLEKIPLPDADDIADRTERKPMAKADRKAFMQKFSIGLLLGSITYIFLTIMRDIRDNYMSNIWAELGYGNDAKVFTKSESTTSIIILCVMGLLVLIRKNMQALRVVHLLIFAGLFIAGLSSFLFIQGSMSGILWMQLTGLGLYMGYIPFNCIFFERFIATFKINGNVGFLMYFIDAFGYLGSVIIMLMKELLQLDLNWVDFYSRGVIIGTIIGLIGVISSIIYFNSKYKKIQLS